MSTRRTARVPEADSTRLDSFRELKGIGPVTEHRLHEAGVYSWSALSTVLEALGAARVNTEIRLRELSEQAAVRGSELGDAAASPSLSAGERTESYIVRISLTDDGRPSHTAVTHVRTQTDLPLAHWSPDEVIRFIASKAGIADRPAVSPSTRRAPRAADRATPPPSREYTLDLDAGKAVGGRRTLEFVVSTERAQDLGSFDYQAELSSRPYGTADAAWKALGEVSGRGLAPGPVPLDFEAVGVPEGLQRIRLRLTVRSDVPQPSAPALDLRPKEPAEETPSGSAHPAA